MDLELDATPHPAARVALAVESRLVDGVAGIGLAVEFLVVTVPGRLVAAAMALCTVVSYLDLGISYETRAFVGAALAVAASVLSEVAFGAFIRVEATWPAHWWRASLRGLGAVGGALFASGGLGALELPPSARAVMLVAIAWIAIGPVLADVIAAYRLAPHTERALHGAVALRALLGAAAAGGLVVYGLAQVLPRMWWLLLLPLSAAGVACAASLLTYAGLGRAARTGRPPPR